MHSCRRAEVLYLGVSDTPAWIVSKANQCMSLPSKGLDDFWVEY